MSLYSEENDYFVGEIMKFIFDIDGTLTDYRTFVKENALPFFCEKIWNENYK